MLEPLAVLAALDTYLRADTTLAGLVATAQTAAAIAAGTLPAETPAPEAPTSNWIWWPVAQPGATYPLIWLAYTPQRDLRGVGEESIWTDSLFTIVAIGQTADPLSLQPIANRLNALVDRWIYSDTTVAIYACDREHPILDGGPENGIMYLRAGALYSVQAGAL